MAHYDETTLVVKHLPHKLSPADRDDFFRHLGAVHVSSIVSEQKKSSLTFARFRHPDEAHAVLRHLHQQIVLGCRLSVEFAKAEIGCVAESKILPNTDDDEVTTHRKIVDAYLRKLHSWTNFLNFKQPPPANLRYLYPPPTSQVLKNICQVMARSTKFYTQVLHLMNRMNLPCPFSDKFDVEAELVHVDFDGLEKAGVKSEEDSEIESENDESQIIPQVKPVLKEQSTSKRQKFFLPKVKQREESGGKRQLFKPDQVFETIRVQAPLKKINVKVSTNINSLIPAREIEREDPEVTSSAITKLKEKKVPESTKVVSPSAEKSECLEKNAEKTADEEQGNLPGVISLEELESNRIHLKDFHLLPVFKNYQPGPPSCRLYIKNLAKTVQLCDLEFIYNRYRVEETSEQVNLFDIRLMQEGRMKGQAFVTLQDVTLAQSALNDTNGYILKGKAIVVQFARSAKPK